MKSKPFPPGRPDSLDDAGEIRRNDWAAFSSLSRMENHWDVKPWPPGASNFYWYLTFGHDDSLASTARACQDALGSFPLRPVAVETLHMTLLRVAGVEAVEGAVLERVVEKAGIALESVSRFELAVGPLAGSAAAIRFSVSPWSPVLDLFRSLTVPSPVRQLLIVVVSMPSFSANCRTESRIASCKATASNPVHSRACTIVSRLSTVPDQGNLDSLPTLPRCRAVPGRNHARPQWISKGEYGGAKSAREAPPIRFRQRSLGG